MSKAPTEIATNQEEVATEAPKKSVVKGLPTSAPVRSGFANGGRPEFKAKSSKATGAKKRVRQ
ncbi:hypothetical protein H8K35_11085 [Undibacterium sp. LX40W]|uniref:Uncharacterized protein n=1 Tax=Undibacterium nitidum TaxID=2762298 RepID=A0A923HSN1_9BURK|nr:MULTISPECIES: hypothetical protein [Undibacterium]MBC3881797.1 hypothetical protein [Undibacterium nitidum]MBC3892206.1 hypothetical protein [Undibacterium sp. LX40W]